MTGVLEQLSNQRSEIKSQTPFQMDLCQFEREEAVAVLVRCQAEVKAGCNLRDYLVQRTNLRKLVRL